MAYKWKPSKSAKREFAAKMQDQTFADAYYQRKEDKAVKRRATSQFSYNKAGGEYVPTEYQYKTAFTMLNDKTLTHAQEVAATMVMSAYSCREATHHDNIHIVNEWMRAH